MDTLHKLIRSLTAPEKRYLRLFATAFRESTMLLRLFDALDSERPDLTVPGLPEGGQPMNAARHNLRRLILKAMRNFRAEDGWRMVLRNMVIDVEFLMGKQLYEDAEKELRKALRLAESVCDHSTAAYIHAKLFELSRVFKNEEALVMRSDDTIFQIRECHRRAATQASLLVIEWRWSRYTNLFGQLKPAERQDFYREHIMPHLDVDTEGDPYAEVVRLLNLSSMETMIKDGRDADRVLMQCQSIFEGNADLKKAYFSTYFSMLSNHASVLYLRELFEESLRVAEKLSADFERAVASEEVTYGPDVKVRHRYALLSAKLRCLNALGRWQEASGLEEEHSQLLKTGVVNPNGVTQLLIKLRFAAVRARTGRPKDALPLIHECLGEPSVKKVTSLYHECLYAEGMCHLMLGNHDLAESRLANLYKVLCSKPSDTPVTEAQLAFLRRAAKLNPKIGKDRDAATKLLEQLSGQGSSAQFVEFISPQDWIREQFTFPVEPSLT